MRRFLLRLARGVPREWFDCAVDGWREEALERGMMIQALSNGRSR
jgi:hypothetical protein